MKAPALCGGREFGTGLVRCLADYPDKALKRRPGFERRRLRLDIASLPVHLGKRTEVVDLMRQVLNYAFHAH